MAHELVFVSELKLGDKVRLGPSAGPCFNDATVYKIDQFGQVSVWRPYIHTGDVVYSGNHVIPYIGVEDFTLAPTTRVYLLEHGPELK